MKKVLLSIVFFCMGLAAWAQVSVTARVDKTALTLDDELTLSVEVNGTSGTMVMPQLPSLPAFNVYSREVEQTSVNGQTTTVFRYVMLPRFVGKATIGSVSFTYNGKTYQTDPLSISIYRNAQGVQNAQPARSAAHTAATKNFASAPVQTADPHLPPLERDLANQAYRRGNENYFLVAAVSDKNPYVNQAVTLAVRFYYNRSFYDAPYQKPSVSDIFMEDAGSSQGTQDIGGTRYRYEEQRYLLTAAHPGTAVVGPATVRYMTGSSPLSALDRLFGGSAVQAEKTAQSAPITLSVRALPQAGRPSSFYGAVGEGYTLSAEADRTQVEAGEAVTVTVIVKGPGNLKPTTDLTLPEVDGLKVYPAAATSGFLPNTHNTRSYKVFKTVLVPAASGIYTVPTVKWSYFNPVTKTYKTLQTTPITLQVSPSTKAESGFDFGTSSPTDSGFQSLGEDIAYLKTSYAPSATLLSAASHWGKTNYAALAFWAVCALFALIGKRTLARKRAYTAARSHLKKAFTNEAVAEALAGYLQEKLNISTGSLPLKDILSALKTHGITPATAESFSLLWQRLDLARFAPGAQDAQSAQELARQAQDILKLFEEETK